MITAGLNPRTEKETLDPASIGYTNEFYLLENLTSRLTSLDEQGNYQLDLASDITEKSPTHYEITIKKTYFSNGEIISLKDVRDSLLRTIRKGSSHTNLKEVISEVKINENKLTIILFKPSKSLFYFLSLPDLGILHHTQSIKETLYADDFIGVSSGPYSYNKMGQSFQLIKNIYYTLNESSFPEIVNLRNPYEDNILEKAKNGEVDIGQASLNSFLFYKQDFLTSPDIKILGVPSDSFTYLFFNKYSSKYKNKEVRKWLSKVIQENLSIPERVRQLSRKSNQYFPAESRAYLSEHDVLSVVKPDEVKKPANAPEKIVIYTYTSAFKVTIESIVRSLESIQEFEVIIRDTVNPLDLNEKLKSGEIDIFLNIMSTDFRLPVEAINFEFFAPSSNLTDDTGEIRKNFTLYQDTADLSEEIKYLKEISKQILKDHQVIPLFHSAVPFFYNASKIDARGLSHLFIFNFWKLRVL
jgi:MarR-like DNA-binding transcriptional regulator SgrR of sgrS sRNA